MAGIFRKKSEEDRLKKQHKKLLAQAYKLSHYDRKESDAKYSEADRLSRKIEELEKKKAQNS